MSIGNTGDTSTFGWGKVLSNNNKNHAVVLVNNVGLRAHTYVVLHGFAEKLYANQTLERR